MQKVNPFDYKQEKYSYEIYEALSERFKNKIYTGYLSTITFNPEPKIDPYDPARRFPIVHITLRPEASDARCVVYFPRQGASEVFNTVPLIGQPESALKDADRLGDYCEMLMTSF